MTLTPYCNKCHSHQCVCPKENDAQKLKAVAELEQMKENK